MEDMIRKSAVMNRLRMKRTEAEMNFKIPSTRKNAVVDCINDLLDLVGEIGIEEKRLNDEWLTDISEDVQIEPEEEEKKPEVPKVAKEHWWEPLMIGSNIGIQRFRCRKCNTIVEREDLYCRHCGSLFGDIVEHKNTKWDSTRNRPVERR